MPWTPKPARPAPHTPAVALLAVTGLRFARGEASSTRRAAFDASTQEVFRVLTGVLATLGHKIIRSEPAAGMIWFEPCERGEQRAATRYRYAASVCNRIEGGSDLLLEGKLSRRELRRLWVSPFRPDPAAAIIERMRTALPAAAEHA